MWDVESTERLAVRSKLAGAVRIGLFLSFGNAFTLVLCEGY